MRSLVFLCRASRSVSALEGDEKRKERATFQIQLKNKHVIQYPLIDLKIVVGRHG